MSKTISWKRITSKHTVKLVGDAGERHWETGSGKLITFTSQERKKAQRLLFFKMDLQESRKKRKKK